MSQSFRFCEECGQETGILDSECPSCHAILTAANRISRRGRHSDADFYKDVVPKTPTNKGQQEWQTPEKAVSPKSDRAVQTVSPKSDRAAQRGAGQTTEASNKTCCSGETSAQEIPQALHKKGVSWVAVAAIAVSVAAVGTGLAVGLMRKQVR
eukprot:g29439.t1